MELQSPKFLIVQLPGIFSLSRLESGNGLHLGPILFNIFINDLTDAIRFARCLLYTDDIKMESSTITSVSDALIL